MHSFHAAVDCTTGQSVFKPKNWNNLKQTIVIDLRVKYFLSHLDAVNDKNMYSFGSSEAEPYPEIHNIRTGRRSENSGGWGATLWALSDPPTPFGWNRINWSAKIWGANVPMPPSRSDDPEYQHYTFVVDVQKWNTERTNVYFLKMFVCLTSMTYILFSI